MIKCLLLRYKSYIFMLRSHYLQTGRRVRAKLEKSDDCQPMTFCRGNRTRVKSFVDRSMRGSRGYRGPEPPPPIFVRGGVLCRCLMDRRGSPVLFYLFFWLASLASIIRRVNVWKILITSKFQSLFSQIVIHTIPRFHESVFQCLFCLKLHDFTPCKPTIFCERTSNTPPPPPSVTPRTHLQC